MDAIWYLFHKKQLGNECRKLTPENTIDGSDSSSEFILINLCNANTKTEQGSILSQLLVLPEKFVLNPPKRVQLCGRNQSVFQFLRDWDCEKDK